MEDLAAAMGVQKGSLYAHVRSKGDLLHEIARDGALAFHLALDGIDERLPGVDQSELRTDLDVDGAALLFLSAANWAYTWLQPGRDTDALADRFYALLLDGMRGYATP